MLKTYAELGSMNELYINYLSKFLCIIKLISFKVNNQIGPLAALRRETDGAISLLRTCSSSSFSLMSIIFLKEGSALMTSKALSSFKNSLISSRP